MQTIQIVTRHADAAKVDAFVKRGVSATVAHILASRNLTPESAQASLKDLESPFHLPDIHLAIDRLAHALAKGETIGLACDFDADGLDSLGILYRSLVEFFGHPAERVKVFIAHRLNDGYGLSDKLAKRIVEEGDVTLVVTADNGSSDGERIAWLAERGIDTIVTDHHKLPKEGVPESPLALVSPVRPDSEYSDGSIAGCGVAFLVMWALRAKLLESGQLKVCASLTPLLSYAAAGTCADCVDLSSVNNRALVRAGLQQIAQGNYPCFDVALQKMWSEGAPLTSEFISFNFAPALNAKSRVADVMDAAEFVLTNDIQQARLLLSSLQSDNQVRKEIQAAMADEALSVAHPMVQSGSFGLVIYLESGHPGINGIVAARVRDRTGLPTIMLADDPSADGCLVGSARGGHGVNMKQCLDWVDEHFPDILKRYGGHKGAAGLQINKETLQKLELAFDLAVRSTCEAGRPAIVYDVERELLPEDVSLQLVHELTQYEPFGMECPAPKWCQHVIVERSSTMGEAQNHLRLDLTIEGQRVGGVCFFHESKPNHERLASGNEVRIVFSLKANYWKGAARLQAVVEEILAC